MVIVARSRSVHGPWENHPRNPIARTEEASESWWSRGHATLVPGPAGSVEDEWWMISHGYENGYRTLGRQILLEPIRWGDDDWPEAAVRDIGGPIEAPVGRRCPDAGAGHHRRLLAARTGQALDVPRSGSRRGGASAGRRRPGAAGQGHLSRGHVTARDAHRRPRVRDRGGCLDRARCRGRPAAVLQQPALLRHGHRR